jgi:hypothetical protein
MFPRPRRPLLADSVEKVAAAHAAGRITRSVSVGPDVLLFDHPGQHRGRAISGIADQAFWREVELRLPRSAAG